jgi:bisanhydrobacterioruberin hydratase
MHARESLRWLAIAAYAVLWIGGIVSRSLRIGTPAPAWAAPLFLVLAATIVSLSASDAWPLVIFAMGGFLAELAGVHTGIPFGSYGYTGVLGPSIAGVPLVISCAWLTLLSGARDLAWRITKRWWIAVITGATLMTAVDLLIDPVATRVLGYWQWHQTGIFFGVPVRNFLGWFAVSVILLSITGRPEKSSAFAVPICLSIILFFALIAEFS